MEAPPNYGPEYVQQFRAAFREVAAKERVLLIPFLLDKVAGQATLNQPDGIHPECRGRADRRRDRVARAALGSRPDGHGPVIELRGVSKTVPSGTGMLTILQPLDLTIPGGRVVAITGASGSGKSTLLGLIAGLDAPSSGIDPDRRRPTSPASARTRSRGFAARRSGSSFSSSICCRR